MTEEDRFNDAIGRELLDSCKNSEGHRSKKEEIKFYEPSLKQEILIKVVELDKKIKHRQHVYRHISQ